MADGKPGRPRKDESEYAALRLLSSKFTAWCVAQTENPEMSAATADVIRKHLEMNNVKVDAEKLRARIESSKKLPVLPFLAGDVPNPEYKEDDDLEDNKADPYPLQLVIPRGNA